MMMPPTPRANFIIAHAQLLLADFEAGFDWPAQSTGAHQAGARDHSTPIWTVLMFDAFLKNVMDAHGTTPLTIKAA